MKWVTRDHVHMDRVASAWLIRRHVDTDAEFVFVPFSGLGVLPDGAIPFGIAGTELGMHDADGSTFRRILTKFKLTPASLLMMADIVESGIKHVLSQINQGHTDIATLKYPEGIGLDAISLGLMYIAESDQDDIDKSIILYDALHAFCRAKALEADHPEILTHPFPARWDKVKETLAQV